MDRPNLLWESSRMILPEHRERILAHQREWSRREKPLLDPQKVEEMNLKLQIAIAGKEKVCLLLFDPYGERKKEGVVEKWEAIPPRICLKTEEGKEWILWDQVIDIKEGK